MRWPWQRFPDDELAPGTSITEAAKNLPQVDEDGKDSANVAKSEPSKESVRE